MGSNDVLYVRSSKKKSNPNGDETSTTNDEEDVWDDTLLIQAYDKAVHLAHSEVFKNMHNSPNKGKDNSNKTVKKHEWKKGDHCRCQYSEDHSYYEAEIIDIIDDVGMCIVRYLGYGNEEKIHLNKLKPSKGEEFRNMQIKQALQENNVVDEGSFGKESDPDGPSRSQKKKNSTKRGRKMKSRDSSCFSANDINLNSYHYPPTANMTIPPPPPPHMFANMNGEVSETEAMNAMLMAWYMSGYHTGYYQGIKAARRK